MPALVCNHSHKIANAGYGSPFSGISMRRIYHNRTENHNGYTDCNEPQNSVDYYSHNTFLINFKYNP